MKNQDTITQLYQDAFSDFEVQAPSGVYTEVQNQLKRKSLLTLDPTRLNVFYLALISGIVAWALIGNSNDHLASSVIEKSESINIQENNPTEEEEVAILTTEMDNSDNVVIVNTTQNEIIEKSIVASESSLINESKETQASNVDVTLSENIDNNLLGQEELSNPSDDLAPDQDLITDETQEIIEDEPTRNAPPQSVAGSKVQPFEELFKSLKHDRDGEHSIKIKKKKNS